MYRSPIELLYFTLKELKRDLVKSEKMSKEETIDGKLHQIHKTNLQPKIDEYQKALDKLLE